MDKYKLDVIYEDNHLIAVNKVGGKLVHGDITGDDSTLDELKRYIKRKKKKPGDVFLHPNHRLDRPVSGVNLFSRTSKAISRMNKLIKDHEVEKIYWALVNVPPEDMNGTLHHHHIKNAHTNKVFVYDSKKKGTKEVKLHYKTIRRINKFTLLEINLETGRSHQIRAQLSKIGCPIVGDKKYGYPMPNPDKTISLHCRSLSFIHPVKKEKVTITADLKPFGHWGHFM